jgi:hypothetical protein
MFFKTVVSLATALLLCTALGAADRLATDAFSANYRTGIPYEKSLNVPAEIRSAVTSNPEAGLPLLVQHLVGDTGDEFIKVKRIHDWITDNIAYDSDLPLEERQQFLNPPVSRAEYLGTPRVSVLYYKYNIQYTPQTIAKFSEAKRDFEGGALQKVFDTEDSPDEIFELRFRAPANVIFFPSSCRKQAISTILVSSMPSLSWRKKPVRCSL